MAHRDFPNDLKKKIIILTMGFSKKDDQKNFNLAKKKKYKNKNSIIMTDATI